MTKCGCHYLLLKHLHVADLAGIVEGYAHRKHISFPIKTRCSSRDVSITMEENEGKYTLSFEMKTQHHADQKWDVVGVYELVNLPVDVIGHDLFTPKGWLRMSAVIWEDQRLWAEYRLKFKRVVQKMRKKLRNKYERYAHELIVEYLRVSSISFNFLYVCAGMKSLNYS